MFPKSADWTAFEKRGSANRTTNPMDVRPCNFGVVRSVGPPENGPTTNSEEVFRFPKRLPSETASQYEGPPRILRFPLSFGPLPCGTPPVSRNTRRPSLDDLSDWSARSPAAPKSGDAEARRHTRHLLVDSSAGPPGSKPTNQKKMTTSGPQR